MTIEARYVYHIESYWFDTGGRKMTEPRRITTFETEAEAKAYLDRHRKHSSDDWMEEGHAVYMKRELVPSKAIVPTAQADTVWISYGARTTTGKAGFRKSNKPGVIASAIAQLFREWPDLKEVEVHNGKCNTGRTTPDPCNCYPEVIHAS